MPNLVLCAVHRARSYLIYWTPVVVWMCVIFTASGDGASFKHSSRIIAPILHWLFPHISDEAVDTVVTVARKGAHLTEYAILAFLVWLARRKTILMNVKSWRWSEAGIALWVAMFYASTDEFHQTFVPSREGCVRDVMIDSSGAVIGLLLLWALGRWRKYW